MSVQLSPELEALVMRDVARGPYRSVDDFVEQAVTELHEREEWLAAHRMRFGPLLKRDGLRRSAVNLWMANK
jgi:Arc/MetJ-type ribon-helix-helix transcriptional regulator